MSGDAFIRTPPWGGCDAGGDFFTRRAGERATLTISLCARGRPQLLLRTLAATLPNIKRSSTKLLLAIDDDDAPMIEAIAGTGLRNNQAVIISCKPREDSRGQKYDRALTAAPADIYLLAVDHAPILTPGFDQMIVDAASYWPDGIGCVYTPMANFSFPALQAVTAPLAAHLGYLYPHDYPFWYIDHHMDDICRMIDRIAYADVNVDCHSLRPSKTLECRDVLFWTAYFDAQRLLRRRQARAIIDSPDFLTPEWQKEILRRHHPLIEHRSAWINNHGRDPAIERNRGGSPPDERYLRIRAKAEERIHAFIADMQAEALKASRLTHNFPQTRSIDQWPSIPASTPARAISRCKSACSTWTAGLAPARPTP